MSDVDHRKDQSICLKTFQGLTKEFWYSIVGYEGQILGQTDKNENEDEANDTININEKRLAYFKN